MSASKKYIYQIPDDPNHAASKVLALVGRNQDVLEVGCASGIQTRRMSEHLGCRVTGIEIDADAAEGARPYCNQLLIGNIETIDLAAELGDRCFDLVTFADVLEHLSDPVGSLRKIRPFLKPGGQVVASIPNIAHAAIVRELANGRFEYRKFGLLDDTHIRFFTKTSVVRLFEEAGFRIESWDRVVKLPQETEFAVKNNSVGEELFMNWIADHNPEAHTYQFIVCARPSDEDSEETDLATRQAEELEQLHAELDEARLLIRSLQSKLSWLEDNRFGPFTRLIVRACGKRS